MTASKGHSIARAASHSVKWQWQASQITEAGFFDNQELNNKSTEKNGTNRIWRAKIKDYMTKELQKGKCGSQV